MDDEAIIRLYWDRDERAIEETSGKFGRYCRAVAMNILSSERDAEECVNDTWLGAWNAMPESWPERLAVFLGKLTRNLAFNKYKQSRAQKRGGGEMELILDELGECVSDADDVEKIIDRRELARAVSEFARSLPEEKRSIFVRRYWYAEAVTEIAGDCGLTRPGVSKTLERMRKQLREFLLERGFEV